MKHRTKIQFRCGWCGAETEVDDYTVVYDSSGVSKEFWAHCPACGELIMQKAENSLLIFPSIDDLKG